MQSATPAGNIDLVRVKSIITSLVENVEKVILGKRDQIHQALACWIAKGHLLIEDVPGTGKTILARALAGSANVPFSRVQFTPDLLPGDIIGASIFRQDQSKFTFIPGPLFTTVLLADEINRATPRTQSALLEAMSEGQITAEGNTYKLDETFFCIATQNPIDQLGTFILPEAQLDRFMIKLSLGYPPVLEEIRMLCEQNKVHPISGLKPIISQQDLVWLTEQVAQVGVSAEIYDYLMKIISATRHRRDLKVGASPRAAIALKRAAQATALIEGHSFVNPSQIYELLQPVLGHRLILTTEAKMANRSVKNVIDEIRSEVKVPIFRQAEMFQGNRK